MSFDERPRAAPRAPALARWLLAAMVDRSAWEILAGDLEEEFRDTVSTAGAAAARRRFWRQTLGSIIAYWRPAAPDDPPPLRGDSRMRTFLYDLRYGLRQFRREPLVLMTAAVTLALGIAATTTIFGMLNALVFRPLPYDDPSNVTFVLGSDTSSGDVLFNMRYADTVDLAAAGVFEDVSFYRPLTANLSGGGLPERVQAYRVSPNTFGLLGVDAARGRTFTPDDIDATGSRVVVLSHGLWQRRYGGDPLLVGTNIVLNGEAHTVLGVMPPPFEYPVFNFKGDLWTPLEVTPEWNPGPRSESPSVVVVARVAPEVGLDAARAGTTQVMARLAAAHPATNEDRGASVVPMGALGRDQSGPAFVLLAVAGVLVLLVACVNVANLLLARSLARGREFAVRVAIGAGRGRVVRQLLAESLLMSAAGGVLAVLLSWWALDALRGWMPDFVVRVLPGVDGLRVDGMALAFAAVVSFATVLVFGLFPAWQTAGVPAAEALGSGSRLANDGGRRWIRQGLVVAEVAMSVALLATTVLLSRSAGNLATADPGFDKDRVLAMTVGLPASTYPDAQARESFFRRLTDQVATLRSVEAVGLVNAMPFSTSDASFEVDVEGRLDPSARLPTVGFRVVTAGYFEAMGMTIAGGRPFNAADELERRDVVIVNQEFSRRYTGGASIGRRMTMPDFGDDAPPFTIVGEVGDVQHLSLTAGAEPEVYLPYARIPRSTMSLAVRVDGDADDVAGAIRSTLAALDPTVAAYDVSSLSQMVENSFVPQTMAASLMRVFGVGALALAAVGLYSLLAFGVGRRTREIGIRVTLGAGSGDVLGLVLRQSFGLVMVGLAFGLLMAWGGAQAMSSLLFGVGPLDPVSYLSTCAVIGAAGLLASVAPARRALGVDPAIALRAD